MKVKQFNYLGILWLKFAKYSAEYINLNVYNTGNVVICKTIVKIQTGRFSNILTVKKRAEITHKKNKTNLRVAQTHVQQDDILSSLSCIQTKF